MRAICRTQPRTTPPGRVTAPHSATHRNIAMPLTVHTVEVLRSGSFMATRPAKPITKNSPIRVDEQSVRPGVSASSQEQSGLADGDDGAGDEHAGAPEAALLLG